MFNIECLELGHIKANCYMLSSDEAAVVIDPGTYSEAVERFLEKNSQKQRIILLTHAHFDHIGGAQRLRESTGVKIAIGAGDFEALNDTYLTLSDAFRARVAPFKADISLSDAEQISVGDISFEAIETPGHTKGGMCFFADNCLFTGDTLFYDSVGRTDFPGSSSLKLENSLSRLFLSFDDSVKVYSGHGPITTIGRERLHNPYVRSL